MLDPYCPPRSSMLEPCSPPRSSMCVCFILGFNISVVDSIFVCVSLEKSLDFISVWSILVGETSYKRDGRVCHKTESPQLLCMWPNAQFPHISNSVQNCVLSPTTSSQ
jgi:hypothetical protein